MTGPSTDRDIHLDKFKDPVVDTSITSWSLSLDEKALILSQSKTTQRCSPYIIGHESWLKMWTALGQCDSRPASVVTRTTTNVGLKRPLKCYKNLNQQVLPRLSPRYHLSVRFLPYYLYKNLLNDIVRSLRCRCRYYIPIVGWGLVQDLPNPSSNCFRWIFFP